MLNKAKIQAFICTLSDEEIDSQIGDLFAFVEEYKQLLIEERAVRSRNQSGKLKKQQFEQGVLLTNDKQTASDHEPFVESSLSFNVINAIQNKVARFTEDELLENMKELDEIISNGPQTMPAHTFEEYCIAKDTCAVRYFEEYKCEPIVCRNCGSYLLPAHKFCGICGINVYYD